MIYYFFTLFVGYAMGRIGHIVGGDISWIPHHWIFGLIIIIVPFFFKKVSKKTKISILLFGLGVLFSDFRDFLRLETFQPEDVSIVKFWGVD